jgi:DNA-binding HxlR family transcriptional regulator
MAESRIPVEAPLSLKAALLQALFAGPGDRLDLVARIAERARAQPRPAPKLMSQALRELESAGLVRHWGVRAGEGRATDPSVYYELTVEGVSAATALREAVAGFLADEGDATGESRARGMDARLRRSLEISALAQSLRLGTRKVRT